MKSNLFRYENQLRLLGGLTLLVFAAHDGSFLLILMGVFMVYTGAVDFCPMYQLLGINRQKALDQYHLSLLPANNPEPVYFFSKHGELVFRNEAARNILPNLRSMHDLEKASEITGFHSSADHQIAGFEEQGKRYMLNYKPIKDAELIAAYAFNVSALMEANEEIIDTQKELLYRMGELGETRSRETGNHVKRVAEYSRRLALLAGCPSDEAKLLKMASPMHDIGKVAIPDAVLLKPGKLDAEEWKIMKTHASIGHDLLRHSRRPILKAASIVAGQHHEKWDGSGYPGGLAGESIHIYGRITALVDVFDALASDRVYKKAWPLEEILELIREQRGKHFDPELVDLLLDNLNEFLQIRDSYQDRTQA